MSTITEFLEWLMTKPDQHRKWKEDKGSKGQNDAKKDAVIGVWEQESSSRLSADKKQLIHEGDPVALRRAVESEAPSAGSSASSLIAGSLQAQAAGKPFVYLWP